MPLFGVVYIHHSCLYEIMGTDNVHEETGSSKMNYCIPTFLTNEQNLLPRSTGLLSAKVGEEVL